MRAGLDEAAEEPVHERALEHERAARDSVFHAPNSLWHQSELGGAFDIGPLCLIGDLDPTGANGVLKEVLGVFGKSLEPLISLLERHRSRGYAIGIKFETWRLTETASQMGAMQLSAACVGVTRHFESDEFRTAPGKLDALVDSVMTEVVRVQRKVRQLLAS